jgi:hypothetical protein
MRVSPAYTEQDLWGTWRLVGASSKDVSSGEVTHAFGGAQPDHVPITARPAFR